ncbi:MAG: hypothetical protein U1F58_00020 [Burkholderiales bacterium]
MTGDGARFTVAITSASPGLRIAAATAATGRTAGSHQANAAPTAGADSVVTTPAIVGAQPTAAMVPEEVHRIRDLLGSAFALGKYDDAAKIFKDLVDNETFVEFPTLPAYERID